MYDFAGGTGYVPQETSHNMLQQSRSLLFYQLTDHIAKNCPDSVEPLIGSTDIVQTVVIQQNLLNNEDGDSLTELRTGLHDAEA